SKPRIVAQVLEMLEQAPHEREWRTFALLAVYCLIDIAIGLKNLKTERNGKLEGEVDEILHSLYDTGYRLAVGSREDLVADLLREKSKLEALQGATTAA